MSQRETPKVISDQKRRMRPLARSASGTKATAPEINRTDWTISLNAVRPKERGKNRAARTKAANQAATTVNHTLERRLEVWLKTLLCGHVKRDCGATLVTVVT